MPLSKKFVIVPTRMPKKMLDGSLVFKMMLPKTGVYCFVTVVNKRAAVGQPYEDQGLGVKASDWSWIFRKEDVNILRSDLIKLTMAMYWKYMEKHNPNQMDLFKEG